MRRGAGARWLLQGAALLTLAGSACAEPKRTVWRCLAPQGQVSSIELPIDNSVRRTSGQMTFHSGAFGYWTPAARLGFSDPGATRENCRCNGIKAQLYEDHRDMIGVSLLSDGEAIELGSVPFDKPVTFEIEHAADHSLTLAVGTGRQRSVSHFWNHDRIVMACTSADVTFDIAPPVKQPDVREGA